jgi:hypothetical protein
MKIEVKVDTKEVMDFYNKFPEMIQESNEAALGDIGMKGLEYMKPATPVITGNLKRSEAYAGSDTFPDFRVAKGQTIPERGGRALTAIKDEVWIGSGLVYAPPVERNRGMVASTFQKLMSGEIKRIFEKHLVYTFRRHQ